MSAFILLVLAAFGAGLINSVAGGGSFLTFPALVFTGVPSIIANASSTVALIPGSLASGWAYRHDFKSSDTFPFLPSFLVSLAGGVVGALLLLWTPQRTFDSVIPWILLGATLLFAFGQSVSNAVNRMFHVGPAVAIFLQFLISIYGGYFGGAVGILMLAVWSAFGIKDIHVMNANKTLLGASMNTVAAALFIVARKVWWAQAIPMLVAAVIGGYIGAHSARRIHPRIVRRIVVAISVVITIAFFARTFRR